MIDGTFSGARYQSEGPIFKDNIQTLLLETKVKAIKNESENGLE